MARIRSELSAETARGQRAVTAELDGTRYAALLGALDTLANDQLGRPQRPRRLCKFARRALRRADRRLDAAGSEDPAERDPRLHDARKAYKRARYAAEALTPLAGKPARRLGKQVSALQDLLGAHQDSVVTGERLRAMGVRAHLDGDNAFTYGLLHARLHDAGENQLSGLPKARRRIHRPKLRRWLEQ
jgi:CHAD domain-containing protein